MRLRLTPDHAGLASGQTAVREFLAASAVTERAAYYTELAFEELLTNVIRHGRPAAGSMVDVSIAVSDSRVVLDFEDDGVAFDPLSLPAPALPGNVDDAVIGGLGIFLIRQTAEHMAYRRTGGRNHLTVAIAQQGD
jgi:anti-sigma regulatory factor (Ser/Thr protein kinase)